MIQCGNNRDHRCYERRNRPVHSSLLAPRKSTGRKALPKRGSGSGVRVRIRLKPATLQNLTPNSPLSTNCYIDPELVGLPYVQSHSHEHPSSTPQTLDNLPLNPRLNLRQPQRNPNRYVKLAMRNMVRKGYFLETLCIDNNWTLAVLVSLAYLTR